MNINNSKERPGAKLMLFGLITFFSFFLASLVGSLIISLIGIPLSLIISGFFIIVSYIFISRIILKKLLKNGSLILFSRSKSGVPIYQIDDKIANAIAVGFSKSFGYIIISSGLTKILNELEILEIINHENNHIHQMHNLTLIIPGILSLLVLLSIVEIAVSSPIILIVGYTMIMSIGLILSLTFSRNIEKLADITPNSIILNKALMKIEDHNKVLRKIKNKKANSLSWLFSTHPPSEERPGKPNELKQVFVAGIYISCLVVSVLVIRIILNSEFNDFLIVLVISLIISVITLGTGMVIIEYLFIYNLMGLLSKKLGVKQFSTINALNGVMTLFIVSAIPIITNITNIAIICVYIINSLLFAMLISALGTKPFKKGLLSSTLTWIVNSIIIIIAVFIFFGINL